LKDWIQQHPQNFEVKNLKLIFNNLKGMHEQFEQLQYAQPFNETLSQNKQEHLNLLDDDIQGFSDLVLKIRQQLTPQSALFRHAVRICCCLLQVTAFHLPLPNMVTGFYSPVYLFAKLLTLQPKAV
jgi:uncharacterized membrane protein YccC